MGPNQAVGLEDKADCPAATLSGGSKRKLQVGIALLADSRVVLLDEPSSGAPPLSCLGSLVRFQHLVCSVALASCMHEPHAGQPTCFCTKASTWCTAAAAPGVVCLRSALVIPVPAEDWALAIVGRCGPGIKAGAVGHFAGQQGAARAAAHHVRAPPLALRMMQLAFCITLSVSPYRFCVRLLRRCIQMSATH